MTKPCKVGGKHCLDIDSPYTMEGFFCSKCGQWISDPLEKNPADADHYNYYVEGL